jgi:hypothetical protein
MTVNNLNLLAYDDVSENRKSGKNGWEGCLAIDGPEWNVVHFDAIGEIAYAMAALIRVCDDNDLMTAIYKFLDPSLST